MHKLHQRVAWAAVALLAVFAVATLTGAIEGGPLDPPAGPAPTDGIREPGTPISSLPFGITAPGRYYVTRNLSVTGTGITITASNVELDLNGFEISHNGAPTSTGIAFSGFIDNAEIHNGSIRGFANGVHMNAADSIRIHDLAVSGSTSFGLALNNNTTVQRCRVDVAAGVGMFIKNDSLIDDCVVGGVGGTGISADQRTTIRNCHVSGFSVQQIVMDDSSVVDGCTVVGGGSGVGINGGLYSVVRDCTVNGTGTGIRLLKGAAVYGCTVTDSDANGIEFGSGAGENVVANCTVDFSGAHGIVLDDDNVIINSTVRNSGGDGILADRGTLIAGNVVGESGAHAIEAGLVSLVINNTARGAGASIAGGAGIQVGGSGNHVEGNTLTLNDIGITSLGSNVIIHNAARQNGTDFSLAASDVAGPAINASSADTATNPYANFDPP